MCLIFFLFYTYYMCIPYTTYFLIVSHVAPTGYVLLISRRLCPLRIVVLLHMYKTTIVRRPTSLMVFVTVPRDRLPDECGIRINKCIMLDRRLPVLSKNVFCSFTIIPGVAFNPGSIFRGANALTKTRTSAREGKNSLPRLVYYYFIL